MGNYLLELCHKFIDKEYDLVDFQSRIETANFPDELVEFRKRILDELEEIRFTQLESDFYECGLEVVNTIFGNLKLIQ